MADKVETVMEKMVDEFQYYLNEDLFSKREVKKIVKQRRSWEYQMNRKDASLLFFMNAVHFEKQLDKLRIKRKKKQGKGKVEFYDHCVKRRVMYLYDRSTRKFKLNIALWKEYMEYLVLNQSYNKLNRVVSQAVQLHPGVLDFWLVGVYSELDLKGNLFSSRKLMLQAIRNNEDDAKFYVEYFRYELRFLEKVRQRSQILNGSNEKKLDFID